MVAADERRMLLRFSVALVGWLACLFGWVSALTFDLADAPGTSVWPPNEIPRNWCGAVGAQLAYYGFYYLGIGLFALLALLTVVVIGATRGAALRDLWLRFLGILMSVTVVATAGGLFGGNLLPISDNDTLMGPGGVVGSVLAGWLHANLQVLGASIVMLVTLVIGLILAADELVWNFARASWWVGARSGPALARSGAAVASTSAVVAGGVATLVNRASAAIGGPAGNGRNGPSAARPTRRARSVAPDLDEDDVADYDDEEPTEPPARTRVTPHADEGAPARISDVVRLGPDSETDRDEPEAETRAADAAGAAGTSRVPVVRELAPPPAKREAARPIQPLLPLTADARYALPSLALLEEPTPVDKAAIELLCREKAIVLEQTLNEFKLAVEVVSIDTGPVITMFELKLAPGIKVSQINSLSNDMARALRAPAVRVVAPLPGKNTIGIEVPNIDKEKVRLKDIMIASASRTDGYAIPLYLGKDSQGAPLVADLTRMPHLLIAGTTGSGKSVCVNSIIMSVLLTRTPDEVGMILIDPKVVELALYKDVPHLMCPIVTDTGKAAGILDWACTKMDERYALLAEAGVKDIRSYNRLNPQVLRERLQIESDEEFARIPAQMPYMIIVVDELADLMMTSAKEVEFFLCRIAQKSRAVGIHLIVSTQRPQANVVTGLIKSNLPSRIAFRVSSRLDSRIVLDQNGGEVLMGQGDMLFLPPGSAKLLRAQGTYISDEELRGVVDHCRKQRTPQFHPELVRIPSTGAAEGDERDELFDQAVDIILETGRGSVSLLQRRLTIGYGRASRLVDQMYAAGIVGEYKGSQAREVIVSKEEWDAIRRQRDQAEAQEAEEAGA